MTSTIQHRIKRFLFIGPTGVGKSTLINILFNDDVSKPSLLKPAITSESSSGSTTCFTTYYNFPDYAYTDSIGLGDNRFDQENIVSMLESTVKNSMVGYNKIYLCINYGRISSEIRYQIDLLIVIFGKKILKWCTIVFTHCNDQQMTKEKYIKSNQHDSYIIDIINSVQNIIFGDNMTDMDDELENIFIKRRKRLLNDMKKDILNSNTVYYLPPPKNLAQWLITIYNTIISKYGKQPTCFEEIQKISGVIANLMANQNFANYYGQCSICLDDMWHTNSIFTKCGHIYHETCINDWINLKNKTCPICRSLLNKEDLCFTTIYSYINAPVDGEEEQEGETASTMF